MEEKIIYDFDKIVDRAGTHSEKYDALKRYFGTTQVEPFWVADMDIPTPTFLSDALKNRTDHSLYGYTEKDSSIYESIIWWMNDQHDVDVGANMITLSPSVVCTISMAIQAFSSIGDRIVVLSPVYGPFFSTVKLHGREVSDCPLLINCNRYEMDWNLIETELSNTKTKMMLLCNPQNPSGRVWTYKELLNLGQLCQKYNVILISDEIHSDIVYQPAKHTSILSIPEIRDNCVMAHSIGKTFNTSGLKSSFSIVPNEELRSKLQRMHRLSHTDNINLFGKMAITRLFTPNGREYKRQLNNYLNDNVKQVYEMLSGVKGLKPMLPEATFLVWCDFNFYGSWRNISHRLINEAKIALSGGTFFGPSGEGWFRINCGHSRKQLLPAVQRICSLF